MTENEQILDKMCKTGNIKKFAIINQNEFEKITNDDTFIIPYPITDTILDAIHLCDNYKSDVLISLQMLRSEIKNLILHPDLKSKKIVFGYRKNGVDGNTIFISNLKDWMVKHNYDMVSNYYRRCYIIDIGFMDENFKHKDLYENSAKYYTDDLYITLHDVTNDISIN